MSSKIKENILELVLDYPEAMDNYNLLVVYYWKHIENANTYNDIARCTSAESITRVFRKLVADGEIILNEDTRKMRREREVEFRKEYAKN